MGSEQHVPIITEIRNRIRKREKSLKLLFMPGQFIIGNHTVKLVENTPLSFEINSQGKLTARMQIAADPKVGYTQKDLGIVLTKMESIYLKEEFQENPAVILCELQPATFAKIGKFLTGLKETVESELPENRPFAKKIAFILKPWDKDEACYLKTEFKDNEVDVIRYWDFQKTAVSIFTNEIAAVWSRSLLESSKSEKITPRGDLVGLLSSHQWSQHLATVYLKKSTCLRTGSVIYVKSHDVYSERNRRIKPNSLDEKNYQLLKISCFDKADVPTIFRKRKAAETDIVPVEQIQWRIREGWVKEQVNHSEETVRVATSKTQLGLRQQTATDSTHALNQQIIAQNKVNIQKGVEERIECHPANNAPKNNNDQNITSCESMRAPSTHDNMQNEQVGGVTEAMRHLGEEFQNVDMLSTNEYPEQSFQFDQNESLYTHDLHQGDTSAADVSNMGNNSYFSDQFRPQEDQIMNGLSQGDKSMQPTPQKVPRVKAAPRSPRPEGNEQLFVFPPPRISGTEHVTMCVKDVRTLDRKEFLNDTVMSFMINYINYFMIEKELQNRIYMSNTFLYSRLQRNLPTQCFSERRPIDPENDNTLVSNCGPVIRWTKKFDVFTKDYLVIPVNEDLHWMVIAVINPHGALVEVGNEVESRKAPKCYIVFYDPLSGLDPSKGNHMCHCIKTYLSVLFQQTKAPGKKWAIGKEYAYDEERVQVIRGKNTPIQSNFSDCGLYALHFIEGLFCSPRGPVGVDKFPDFNWTDIWPAADNICDLMRDKVYNLILHQAGRPARSRLEKYEKYYKCGLNREGNLRKARRHSAINRRAPRHEEFHPRHYSLSPPNKNIIYEDPTFTNPRRFASMPITQRVRQLRIPEENFPIAY